MSPIFFLKNLIFEISAGGEFTLFVPSEAAFQKIPQDIIDKLMKNKTLLMEALTFHIVPVKLTVFNMSYGF